MASECARCGRWHGSMYMRLDPVIYCNGLDCAPVEAGDRRGFERGMRTALAIAREELSIDESDGDVTTVDWSDAVAKIERRLSIPARTKEQER